MIAPNLNTPNKISNTPAMSGNDESGFTVLLYNSIYDNDKSTCRPPICTLLPPIIEMMNPAMIAVIIPFSGETPETIPNAMASGKATIPTMIPAIKSAMNNSLNNSSKQGIALA